MDICYECEEEVPYVYSDGRCKKCWRDDITEGEAELVDERYRLFDYE